MSKIVLKIIDAVQYTSSSSYKNLNVSELLVENVNEFICIGKSSIFSSVDNIEFTKDINYSDYYVFPFFYEHEEKGDSHTVWVENITNFLSNNLNILKNKNVAICVCDLFEASQNLLSVTEELKDKFNLNFWIVTADKKISSTKLKVIYNNTWIGRFEPSEEPIVFNPEKLYINLTRVSRHHRCRLLEKLIDNNLFDLGFNSWGDTYGAFARYKIAYPETKIKPEIFKPLDINDLSSVNPNFNVPYEHCTNSFLFLTTETKTDSNMLFFSEKAYKPIGIGMPFITLGNPGTLEDLRNQGFFTFNEWFDESYDLDYPLEKRIDIIINNLLVLSKYSVHELVLLREQMKEILTYNQSLYRVLKKKNYLRENMSLIIKGLK